MRKGNRIYGIITVLLLSLGACSLIHDDMEELGYREDGSAYAYVSLTIHTGTTGNVTRSNPTGGEDGDGYEKGQDYENSVNNLTLFFYPATLGDGGVNRDNVNFTAKVYITNPAPNGNMEDGTQPIDKTFTVGPVKVDGLKTNQQYHVLAVANAGDLADPKKEIVRLDDLRKAEINQVYAFSEQEGYSNFVMASEGDEHPVLEISSENSETNPAETTINLERLVARVDYKTIDNNVYQLSSSSLLAPGLNPVQAKITRAFLVNTYNQDTYVLKRVAEGNVNGTITYLGSLSNYVIDPKTTSKTIPVPEDKNIPSWYDHYFPNLSDEVGDDGKTKWEDWLIVGDEVKDPDTQEAWFRLGYPKENTSSIDAQGKYYSTGVVFEARYDFGEGLREETFFLVNGTTLYATLEDAMEAHNNNSFDEGRSFTSYEDLQKYIEDILKDNDPAGYKAFLQEATEQTALNSLTWASYKANQLGYDTEGNPTATTRKELHKRVTGPNKTETFLNGRGYYTYWIRHNYGDKDNVVSGLPMENAIVRNNIYKLTVRSIKEIGNDVPGDKTLDILVAVAKWNLLDEENIDLEPTN